MTIQAVIFDMDGVLVDSEVYWGISREEFARDLGKEWTDAHQRLAMGQSTVGWAKVMQELTLTRKTSKRHIPTTPSLKNARQQSMND